MGRKKPTARDEETAPAGGGGGGKSKKKGFVIADDEYSIGTELSEDAVVPEEKVAPVGNKKKGKKGGGKKMELKDEDEEMGDKEVGVEDDDDDDDAPEIKFAGKKKPKGKKSGTNSVFSSSSFGLLGEDDDNDRKDNDEDDEEQEVPVAFSGKKKPSKSKKSGGTFSSAFELLDEEEESKDKDESSKEEEADLGIAFTGKKKKKSSKGLKKASGSSFSAALLDDENDEDASVSKVGDDLAEVGGDDQEEDILEVKFSGKKKSSKKKNNTASTAPEVESIDTTADFAKPDGHTEDSKTTKQISEDVADTSKNKKKKKKGGKAGQEDDDLDKILAELGGAPTVSTHAPTPVAAPVVPPPVEKVQNQPEPEEAAGDKEAEEEGPVESVASKKKKKKKEKEKEKKAAAAAPAVEEKQEEVKSETNNKAPGKKVPKHVREMQEKLARLKEAEEKKKREEEERLRKEEEERLRQEELERLAEEKKRLKKEREKEKLLKKKQEGKLLTGKQKEEARRLEAMRKQILANAAALQLNTGEPTGAPAKRPLYQKKKSKPQAQSNGAATSDNVESTSSKEIQQEIAPELDLVEAKNVEEVESSSAQDKTEVTGSVEENGVNEEQEEDDDDDEEWDAKSWDDADLKLPGKSAFADEEADSEPEPLLKKEEKNARTAVQDVVLPTVATKSAGLTDKVAPVMPLTSENVEVKKKSSEAEGADNKNNKVPVNQDKKNKKETVNPPVQNGQNLRSPICCIMGHVDTGKTKLLDCIRGTNVQEGEAGGITQQIGATYFPAENIRERTKELKADAKLNVPGLLVIDTPGHESFTNLRSRGSGLCDIAILVVDIMHGLEPQTIESLNLLKMRNTEFIVALNKVDRLYGWKTCRNAPITKAMKQQSKDVQLEFNTRLTQVITQFKEQGLNTELYYKNKEMGETFSIVPTSAISGEGIPDLLLLLVQWTQKTMVQRLTYSDEVQCTVLEVKVIEGHGTTIDVVLVNGVLHEGDQIVVCGLQGPIVTTIRALLTPHPMKELRVKGTYLHHKEIKAAQGIKITAQGLEHAIAGTSLYVVGPHDDLEDITEAAMEDMKSVMSRIDKSGEGVYVQASTLGSLEALLEFLKSPAVSIPVSGISIGPVHKKDVMKASVMLEKKKEYGTILAFDVKVTPEARELADELGVKIFIADIIYHLFDQFKAYIDNLKEEKKKEAADEAVFPCVLKIIPNCVFNKKDPIVLGVDILEGVARIGTPICVPQREFIEIGRIASIENNHKPVDYAKKGQKVAIKIIGSNPEEQQKMFGRHFEIEDELVSKISRNSLDALKEHYAEDLSVEEKRLLFKLKKLFKIP
ncbi:Eukaryotic translation initiation factor 5B [Sesamum alatum]|uniref:Eukaryotic translation initiation factor 5B n=1 Tax=Sesamum alatum TaxID=300844 RepID=A0AAE1YPT3_9LAMI|nr:Eukaryotic translation initiation factor 5B [Sesamum alatum]